MTVGELSARSRYAEEEATDNVGYLVIDDEIACPLRESVGSLARVGPPLTVVTFLYRWAC